MFTCIPVDRVEQHCYIFGYPFAETLDLTTTVQLHSVQKQHALNVGLFVVMVQEFQTNAFYKRFHLSGRRRSVRSQTSLHLVRGCLKTSKWTAWHKGGKP